MFLTGNTILKDKIMQPTVNPQDTHGDVNTGFHSVFSGVHSRRQPSLKDFKLGRTQAPVSRPASYMPNEFFNMTSVSQGKQPDCGGAGGMNYLEYLRYCQLLSQVGGPQTIVYENLSMRFLYDFEKSIDGFPGQDGTTIKAIGMALTVVGSCREELCQNDTTLSNKDFANWSTVSQAAKDDALPRKLNSYLFLDDLSMEGIKQAIFQNKAVVLEAKIGNEWYTAPNGNPSYLEADVCPIRPPKPVISAHFFVAGAYDENYIYFINSFGSNWGRHGFGYFGQNYIPYVTDGLVVSTTPPQVLTPTQYNWYESILISIQNVIDSIKASMKGRPA